MYSISPTTYASVTEIHEDAASSTATGGHKIVSSSLTADSTDLKLSLVIKNIVEWWGSVKNTKGISYRNNLLNLNVAAQRGINYRLMELGFITNKNDMDKIKANLDQYAKGIVEGITGEKLGGETTVTKPKRPKRAGHKVVTYWYIKGNANTKKVEQYLKENKLRYKIETAEDKRIKFIVSPFVQYSAKKAKLVKFLEDNNCHYEVLVA